MKSIHRSVLLNETIEGLLARRSLGEGGNEDFVILDATFGGGGHSEEVLRRHPEVKIIALDQDSEALKQGEEKFKKLSAKITFANANFRDLDKVLKREGVEELDGIIFDLGLSSDQLGNSSRGFSFLKDEPLLMTMKKDPGEEDLTAEEIENTWDEKNIADIIYGYGEERYARRSAKAIAEVRKKKKIQTTGELVEIIEKAVPARYAGASARRASYKRGKIHPATRTFQAIRITVNDELGALREGLDKGFECLKKGGRMAVISFHSLEDRIVKNFFSAKGGSASGGRENRVANIITKKPIRASEEEIKNNPRARSAKLRILEKI